jgi:hypothetical protein
MPPSLTEREFWVNWLAGLPKFGLIVRTELTS